MNLPDNVEKFNSIAKLGESILKLAKKRDITELEKELPEYTRNIENYFKDLDKEKLTYTDIENLKQLMSTHEKIVNLINQRKDKISENIKKLHTGKEMQKAYPQTSY